LGFKIVLNPFRDPAEGLDFHEQVPIVHKKLIEQLGEYPQSLQFELFDGEQGAGASWGVIILEVMALGPSLFFGVPKVYSKIGKAVEGWKQIWADIHRFIAWLTKKERIAKYSIEIAFYCSLARLSKRRDVRDIELVQAQEILGQSGSVPPTFENTEISYYLFLFREGNSALHIMCMDHTLKVHVDQSLALAPTGDYFGISGDFRGPP
jgi:hypothetical protein